jgi:hypothetical protein
MSCVAFLPPLLTERLSKNTPESVHATEEPYPLVVGSSLLPCELNRLDRDRTVQDSQFSLSIANELHLELEDTSPMLNPKVQGDTLSFEDKDGDDSRPRKNDKFLENPQPILCRLQDTPHLNHFLGG